MLTFICLSFAITFILLVILLKTRLADFALDQPNARSLHVRLTPRTGGLAVILGVLVTGLIAGVSVAWLLLLLTLVAVSLVDDIRGLSVFWRLFAQLMVCGIFVFLYHQQLHYWLWLPVLLVLIWMTNLYNFMDGADGLAGGMGLFGFSAYAIAFYLNGDILLSGFCAAISASCLAFLLFNFHPAKIFMGDSGSIPLGFLAGAMGLVGCVQGYWSTWFPLLVFSPFIVDATVTLIKRWRNGERLSQAHKSHYYQHLVQMGWGHKKTAVLEYMLMLLGSTCALAMLKFSDAYILVAIVVWVFIYLLVALWIDRRWQHQLLAE